MGSPLALAPLETRVRHLVRESGIDPQRHINALDRLIEQALEEQEERFILGEEQRIENKDSFRQYMRNDLGGYGVLQPLLDDPEIEEIWIDEPSKIFISRGGRTELTNIVITEQEVRDSVEKMLRASGRRIDLSVPFVDAALASGERLHVVIPDVTREHWAVNIRK
ncbi:MAG: Flp pilus assembly complex ATPase component TadA, partial [Actinomycetaceae bacterium]|nr:Flp pilus assembly complex ATPase component TadA [Actinomycetaceae bacterium]